MFDYHMHSVVSFDGHDTPEAMVKAALAAGLKEICFTDHVDDDPAGIITDQCFCVEDYNAAYDRLSTPGLTVRKGLEFGMLPDNQATVKKYLSQRKFDFVIGSMHYADGVDMYYPVFWEGKTMEQAEQLFLEETLACLEKHGDFDVLGHLTYLSKARSNPTHRVIRLESYRELVEQILKTLIRKGKGMEINTSGLARTGDFLPPREYLQLFKDLGGEIVTVGSDAHTASRVGDRIPQALEVLKDIFGYVCTFEDRKPIFHKL